MPETDILFYGKRLLLRRSNIALSWMPGEEPPMLVPMSCLITTCPLGRFTEQSGLVETCGSLIQIPLDLAPSAVMCPNCFSLFFVDESRRAARYHDADWQWSLEGPLSLFGYATYPYHTAQRELHSRIRDFTSGCGVLVAMRYEDAGKEMFGGTGGRYVVLATGYTQVDLLSSLPQPSEIAAHICGVAFTSYETGRYTEAIGMVQRALTVEPEFVGAHFLIGLASDAAGLLDDATRAYQAGLRINPDLAEAHYNLGVVYGKQGRPEDEIREYQEALRIKPDFAPAHLNLGVEYSRQGRLDEAARELQAVLLINPDQAEAHFNLGVVYAQQRRWHEAAREYQAALRIQPNYAEAHHNLGVVYDQLGRLDEAIQEYQAALRITPNDPESHCNLGVVCWKLRRVDEAIREWQIAARMGYQPAREWLARVGLV